MSRTSRCRADESVTPESIALAKRAQALERIEFERETGVAVDDYGRIAHAMAQAITVACYGRPPKKDV